MRVVELIARAARRRLEADPDLLGVRVCPVALDASDAAPLAREVAAQLGPNAFLAASIPGAEVIEQGRAYVARDQSAAERATKWRNELRVEDGEHLVYVSVQVHGKAGGLQECLTPIDESALRAEFVEWSDSKGSGLPPGLGECLEQSGILDRVSSRALCEYANAIQRDSRRSGWEACGHHLPVLNLARDTALRAGNAASRIAENDRVVSRAATGERAAGVSDGPVAELRDAFKAAGSVSERLKSIDLAAHITEALGRPRRGPRERQPTRGTKPAKLEKRTKAKAKPARERLNPTAALVDAVQGATSRDKLAEVERKATKLRDGDAAATVAGPADSRQAAGGAERLEDFVWTRSQQSAEFGSLAERMPLGLAAMLTELMKRRGFGLRWSARESARALLVDLPPKLVPDEASILVADQELQAALDRLVSARRGVADLLSDDDGRPRKLAAFISSPLVSLADRALRSAVSALLRAHADFHALAASAADPRTRAAALEFDTVSVRARTGDAVLVLSPLHPLWLSQAVGRFDAMLGDTGLSAVAKRLLVRSLSEAPAAPDEWPAQGQRLQLSRPVGGLVAYQAAAEELEPKELADAVARAIALYCDHLPHTLFGMRVAVVGAAADPVVEGAATALEENPDLRRIVLHHRGGGVGDYSSRAQTIIAAGRLALEALPVSDDVIGEDIAPHIIFHISHSVSGSEGAEEAAPVQAGIGGTSGLLPTEFRVVGAGLSARTPIDVGRFPALAAFEALHALVSGRQPQGAFTRSAWAASLRELLEGWKVPTAAWHVVLASRVSRRPPAGQYLLSYDRPSDRLSFAITGADIAPASRGLRDAFRAIGVEDLRPLVLSNLAVRLASTTSQGIISPVRKSPQVLAASVLGMALRREFSSSNPQVLDRSADPEHVDVHVAHLEGDSGVTLLGSEPASVPGAFAIGFGAANEQLRIVLGYAALGEALDADFARGQLTGRLAEYMTRLAASVSLASSGTGAGSVAAREALNWLLWPALASSEHDSRATQALLTALGRGTACDVSAICYLPPDAAALKRGGTAKLDKLPVMARALDVTTFEELVFGARARRPVASAPPSAAPEASTRGQQARGRR